MIAANDTRLLDTDEAAAVLRLSPGTLTVWRSLGRGPRYTKLGDRVLYSEKDIADYVAANTRDPAPAGRRENTRNGVRTTVDEVRHGQRSVG